jgi:hypothetical protein
MAKTGAGIPIEKLTPARAVEAAAAIPITATAKNIFFIVYLSLPAFSALFFRRANLIFIQCAVTVI